MFVSFNSACCLHFEINTDIIVEHKLVGETTGAVERNVQAFNVSSFNI